MQSKSFFHRCLAFVSSFTLFFIGFFSSLYASHNLAGQLSYIKTGTNTYELTLTTYTDPSSQLVDRPIADFLIYSTTGGQYTLINTITGVKRSNGNLCPDQQFALPCSTNVDFMGLYFLGSIKENIYKTTYQFSGPGNFLVAYTDDNRINNVKNMLNSGGTSFSVSTLIKNTPQLGSNNSPRFLNRPIDFACTNKKWTHNPGGYDVEGDSLHYQLIPCLESVGTAVSGYNYPSFFGGTINQDPNTGLITWDSPQQIGIYNVAFLIEEFRNGIKIGEAIRDMAIFVDPCNNEPPIIEAITDTCVRAGDTLRIPIKSWDPNFPLDSLYFSLNNGGQGLNGPFVTTLTPPATLTFNPPSTLPIETRDTVRGLLEWATNCSHVRKSFYQVDLFAHDNFSYYSAPGKQMLSVHHIIQITVSPPAVTGLNLTTGPRRVTLNWNLFSCNTALGYKVYRSFGTGGSGLDSVCCENSPESAGFELIYANTDINQTTYIDDLSSFPALNGNICYTVVAYFAGNQLSCPSSVECVQLATESFVMTNASIGITDAASGTVFVAWSSPDTSKINKLFYPPPYSYDLFRADEIQGAATYTQLNTLPINYNDTTFNDGAINTAVRGYRYYASLRDSLGKIAQAITASSIYLKIQPQDHALNLNWDVFVPWQNDSFQIFRADVFGGPYLLHATVPGGPSGSFSYLDSGLDNYRDYCYFVRSFGKYPNYPDVKDTLINDSEKKCDQPRDLTPPCIDSLVFDTTFSCAELEAAIFWSDVDSTCAGDIAFFTVYKSSRPGAAFVKITDLPDSARSYQITDPLTIANCYSISATDTSGNESNKITFCFENCPQMEASNIFSPNGDGYNDFFSPLKQRSVKITSVLILDRWGVKVFLQENVPIDPVKLWNGITMNGAEAQEGVYFYLIDYETITLGGNVPMPKLQGYVVLVR